MDREDAVVQETSDEFDIDVVKSENCVDPEVDGVKGSTGSEVFTARCGGDGGGVGSTSAPSSLGALKASECAVRNETSND